MKRTQAIQVAEWYSTAKHDPDNPLVQNAYASMIDQTVQQYCDIIATGFRFDFTDCDPYANSNDLFDDYNRGGMKVFVTDVSDMPVDHPLAKSADRIGRADLVMNDIFRAVHDYYGHCVNGYTFGPIGEDRAYRYHRTMYDQSAQPALAAETRGQNSWFNYGPHADCAVADRPFAKQLATIAPNWIVSA